MQLGEEGWCQDCTQFFTVFIFYGFHIYGGPGDEGSSREFTEITNSSIFGGRGVTSPNSTNSPILSGSGGEGSGAEFTDFNEFIYIWGSGGEEEETGEHFTEFNEGVVHNSPILMNSSLFGGRGERGEEGEDFTDFNEFIYIGGSGGDRGLVLNSPISTNSSILGGRGDRGEQGEDFTDFNEFIYNGGSGEQGWGDVRTWTFP